MADRVTPFGKYYLLERINVGGMAEVFKAKTLGVEGFEKIVAIKRILPSVAEDEEFIKMFVDEAKITSQLSHANLAQTFDLGKINETFYIAMEYVPGKDLRAVFERLKRRGERMPLHLAAYVMARVCEGLDYAHRKRDINGQELNIVHRDVSPQNVIISFEGEVKLIDFGIAKAANKITKTQAGILKGKFGYMSPEQVRGLPIDRRSDIFAAGVVLYELCTGERLFTGGSDFSVLEKVQLAKVTKPSLIAPNLPLKLERVILKALAREPEDRYQHAADLSADLTRFLLEAPNLSRDQVAAFMKATFPDDNAREEASSPRLEHSPPPESKNRERAEPTATEPQRGALDPLRTPASPRRTPPPLPASLTQDLPLPPARAPRPVIRPTAAPPILEEQHQLVGAGDPEATFRGPVPDGPPAEMLVRSKQPAELAGDDPTRPMSMADLAAKERQYAAREAKKGTLPWVQRDPAPLPNEPPRPAVPRRAPPPPKRTEAQKRDPYGGRMVLSKPTLIGDDPLPAEERTVSTITRPARFLRRAQYALLALFVCIAAWAFFSPTRAPVKKPEVTVAPPSGSVAVTTAPADAVLLLDGAQVKDPSDQGWNEAHLSAGLAHTLTARREGFVEQVVPLTLKPGETRTFRIELKPLPGELALRSSPPGAQIFIDGQKRGLTPAYLPDLDAAQPHAISLEKNCYRPWQIGVPAYAGRRNLAATLELLPSACPGRHLDKALAMPAPEMPGDLGMTPLGFLSLSSRPSANVVIDGVDIGRQTPLFFWPLKSGSHRLRVIAGKRSRELSIEVRTGETHSEQIDLEPARKRRRR